ncbi:hypothetical protein EUX98_g3961 [Antrodiella citrinella]|uniref:Uncharacterized protein n=1 Tax=Antrodiella citrinella TaxID=2447956 RepID=A0A4S4MXC6_9APHY|nr:hypothetical protein EUX98_g3961 [Antrodiella citrinella]
MPILGLFSKRDKHKHQPQPYAPYKHSTSSEGDADSSSVVETAESSLPNSPLSPGSPPRRGPNPVYGNSPLNGAASSSKIKLGFRRKKSSNFVHVERSDVPSLPPVPHPPTSPSAHSEPDVERFRPPPAKGALFSAYGDSPGALSTRSLPVNNKAASHTRTNSRDVVSADNVSCNDNPPPTQPAKKSGGLFGWAHRDRKKSQPAALQEPAQPPPRPSLDTRGGSTPISQAYNSDSFNLKSFRHVGPPETSELQLPRPPSSMSTFSVQTQYMTPPLPSEKLLLAEITLPAHMSSSRPSMGMRTGDSSSDDSEYEASEDDEDGTLRPKRGDTITGRNPKSKATTPSSELGHRLRVPAPGPERVARTTLGHGETDTKPRSNFTVGQTADERPSTLLALASSGYFDAHRRSKSASSSSTSSGSDSDDAPLATLLMPKRPGSSASNATTSSRPRVPVKPLIDIKTLSSPSLPMPMFGENPLSVSPTDEKFTPPKEEERDRKPTLTDRLARVAAAAKSDSPTTGPGERRGGSLDLLRDRDNVLNTVTNIHGKAATTSSPKVPTRSQTAPIGFDPLTTQMPSNAPPSSSFNRSRTPDPTSANNARRTEKRLSMSSSPIPNVVVDLTDPTPIRPTPVRERSPQASFSVTSRPASQMSLGSSSQSQETFGQSTSQATVHPPRPRHAQPTVRVIGANPAVMSSGDSTSTDQSSEESESDDVSAVKRRKPTIKATSASMPSLTSPSSRTPPATSLAPGPRPRPAGDVLRAPPPRTSSMYALDNDPRTTKVLIPAGSPSTVSSSTSGNSLAATRKRASTLIPSGSLDVTKGFTGTGLLSVVSTDTKGSSAIKPSVAPKLALAGGALRQRQRSSTVVENSPVDKIPERPPMPLTHSFPNANTIRPTARLSSSQQTVMGSSFTGLPPPRPFAGGMRGKSPSASSNGDSSSTGRTPITPRDGSEISVQVRGGDRDSDLGSTATGRFSAKGKEKWSGSTASVPTAGMRSGHKKSSSVSFDEPEKGRMKVPERDAKAVSDDDRRRERRRSEAKAAIELGNVVNGRGPIAHDDDEDDLPLNSMGSHLGANMNMNMMNPMFNLTPPSPMTWRPPSTAMGGGMNMSPMSMFPAPPPNADAAFLAAHQQAMMVAKQAYQYAVAQQAMAQANDEWERGSTATSAFGGGGGGGSTYGGSAYGGSSYGGMGMSMGGMGMNPMQSPMQGMYPPYGMWPGPMGPMMMFPQAAQSMYAGSVVGSELGTGSRAGWASKSAYGDTGDRSSVHRGGGFSSSASVVGVPTRPGARPRTKTAPSSSAARQQQQQQPPSSWKRPA